MAATYQIIDEPQPSALDRLAVNPVWPLLAIMFAGAWLAWPWSALNGFAIGSPTRRRELLLAAGGFAGNAAIIFGLSQLAGVVSQATMSYLVVGLTVWKLAVSYWLYTLQARAFHLWEHFGGQPKNGILVVIAAAFVTGPLFATIGDGWRFLLR